MNKPERTQYIVYETVIGLSSIERREKNKAEIAGTLQARGISFYLLTHKQTELTLETNVRSTQLCFSDFIHHFLQEFSKYFCLALSLTLGNCQFVLLQLLLPRLTLCSLRLNIILTASSHHFFLQMTDRYRNCLETRVININTLTENERWEVIRCNIQFTSPLFLVINIPRARLLNMDRSSVCLGESAG